MWQCGTITRPEICHDWQCHLDGLTGYARLLREPQHNKTNKVTVRPAKTQINLGIRPVWSESSLCAQWVAKDTRFLHADSEYSDQPGHTLIRLGGCPGWSESSLGVQSLCWFYRVAVHLVDKQLLEVFFIQRQTRVSQSIQAWIVVTREEFDFMKAIRDLNQEG